MKLFVKGKALKDERIVNTENKLYKEAYIVAMVICFASIIVKTYLYGFNTSTIGTELLILIVSGFYYSVRTVKLGLYSDEIEMHDRTSRIPMSLKNIIIGIVSGALIALFFGIRSAVLYGNDSNRIWYFIITFIASISIYVPFYTVIIVLSDAAARRASKKASEKNQDNDL